MTFTAHTADAEYAKHSNDNNDKQNIVFAMRLRYVQSQVNVLPTSLI